MLSAKEKILLATTIRSGCIQVDTTLTEERLISANPAQQIHNEREF